MEDGIKLVGLKIRQNGKEGFATTIKLKDIVNIERVRHKIDKDYQRPVNRKNAKKAGKYYKKGGTFDTSIVVSVAEEDRDKVTITPNRHVRTLYDIYIPYDVILKLVDGQHRIKGIEIVHEEGDEINLEDTISVILYNNLSWGEERDMFNTINANQTGVKGSVISMNTQVTEGIKEFLEMGTKASRGNWLANKYYQKIQGNPHHIFHNKIKNARHTGIVSCTSAVRETQSDNLYYMDANEERIRYEKNEMLIEYSSWEKSIRVLYGKLERQYLPKVVEDVESHVNGFYGLLDVYFKTLKDATLDDFNVHANRYALLQVRGMVALIRLIEDFVKSTPLIYTEDKFKELWECIPSISSDNVDILESWSCKPKGVFAVDGDTARYNRLLDEFVRNISERNAA